MSLTLLDWRRRVARLYADVLPNRIPWRRDTVKGAGLGGGDGHLILDFNFACNPSCAYDRAWACPLAPPGNTLARPQLAGELAGDSKFVGTAVCS